MSPVHIISLGAGVQSSTMALMAAAGEITPMPLCAIFADTQAEPQSVYDWLAWLETQLPFPVHSVTKGDIRVKALELRTTKDGRKWAANMIPAFTQNKDGRAGMMRRQCTREYKIRPITKEARKVGGIKRGQKTVGVIQWIGISRDEAHRMKPSRYAWQQNRYPLVDMAMKRSDCLRWMKEHGFPEPPRSACYFCPMKGDAEWLAMKTNEPEEFAKAVAIDEAYRAVRNNGRGGLPYIHRSLLPLDQVPFESAKERDLWGNECEGMCGV